MSNDNKNINDDLKMLIGNSELYITDPDFDDKLMKRIELISIHQSSNKKNLKFAWMLFIVSIILCPLSFIYFFNSFSLETITILENNTTDFSSVLLPAGIIFFALILLLQLDNLLKLSFRRRFI